MTKKTCAVCGRTNLSVRAESGTLHGEIVTLAFCLNHRAKGFDILARKERKPRVFTKKQRKNRQLRIYAKTVAKQSREIRDLKAKLAIARELDNLYESSLMREREKRDIADQVALQQKTFLKSLANVWPEVKERVDAFFDRLSPKPDNRMKFASVGYYGGEKGYRSAVDSQAKKLKKHLNVD